MAKAEKKGRAKSEVDAVLCWLTGSTAKQLERQLKKEVDVTAFFADEPALKTARRLITSTVCGVRVEDIPDPLQA